MEIPSFRDADKDSDENDFIAFVKRGDGSTRPKKEGLKCTKRCCSWRACCISTCTMWTLTAIAAITTISVLVGKRYMEVATPWGTVGDISDNCTHAL